MQIITRGMKHRTWDNGRRFSHPDVFATSRKPPDQTGIKGLYAKGEPRSRDGVGLTLGCDRVFVVASRFTITSANGVAYK